MGQQDNNLSMSITHGASVMVIDQVCDNDQLLVSLNKNDQHWLSPVGWTDQQKVTLLECRSNGETTEIDIPAEFANDIKTGDVLVLRCSELDLEKEIIWEASEVERRVSEDATAAAGLASGLFSRFKSSKTEVQEDTKSEAQLRAEEADRAAQGYKAKMEAAAAAKEAAQRKALEAAREAESALKMEAERIAEMERAAKAFEEAERLKQDELRRVEEERRAEEARLAEEARRLEEARKREIAAKKDAERKAALERYEAGLDVTRNEELRLKSRLKDLKRQAKSDASNMAVQREDLESRQGLLVTTEEAAAKRFDSYEKSAIKLEEMTADLFLLESESETLTADRQALSIRLSQADTDYQQAQTEAEAAMAKAEARRAELDLIRQDEGETSGKILSVSEKLSSQSQIVSDVSEKTQKLRAKLETAQAEMTQAKAEIKALEQSLANQAEQDKNLRLETEATQQAIEDSQAREKAYCEAIEHLEAGGSPEGIAEIDFEVRSYEIASFKRDKLEADISADRIDDLGFKDRMLGRVRRSFAREKDAQISIDIEEVVLDAADIKADPVLLAGLDDTPSFLRRHSSSLIALGAVMGGIAILGGGLALNKSASPKLEVKSSTPAPTQVASAVSKVELPKVSELTALETKTETVETKTKDAVFEMAPPRIETVKIDSVDIETEVETPLEAEDPKPEVENLVQDAMTATEVAENAFIVKLAEVVDPTGFAFELPDMRPIAEPKRVETKAETKKPASEKIEAKTSEAVKTVAVTQPKAKPEPKAKAEVNYPELTSDVQTRLTKLGLYDGEIDGLQGRSTKDAITNFKTLFSMAETNDKITGAFLTELKRAEREQETAELQAQAQARADAKRAELEAQRSIQVAEAVPAVTYYDTVQAVPSTPVVTDTLPAAEEIAPVIESTPSYIEPEPESVKVASIPPTISEPAPTPAAQDVIVEARALRNVSAKYPPIAERRNYYVNAVIEIAYDIDETGRPVNLRIVSNDHNGKYNSAFEKEALRAIEKTRYKPKTVNGTPVQTKDIRKRIVFRGE